MKYSSLLKSSSDATFVETVQTCATGNVRKYSDGWYTANKQTNSMA
jgi:hypothetical protein